MQTAKRRAEDLYSDIFMPAETIAIRREARQFAEDVIRPIAYVLNTTPETRDTFPRALYDALAKEGLYRIPYPADVGGRGLEFPTLATLTVLEELAYFSPSAASALYDAQAILFGKTLEHAPGPLRERYLPKLVRGELIGAFATSEPAASTDLSPEAMQTTATHEGTGWRINGRKRWITNSVAADFILVLCRTGERQTLFLADMHQEGISVGEPDLKMGNNAQLTADVVFDSAFASDDHVIGKVGGGLKAALAALTLGRMGIGAIGVAMAQAAFDHACSHMETRKVFGRELARFQHWQFSFADHAIAIENARALYQKAAFRYDVQGNAETEAAMSKVVGSEVAVDVARDAIQVCGAYGFARHVKGANQQLPLESIYRDAKVGEIYEGANEIQRWIVARKIFGRELTG
jgi:alkylation response protein AidB-like acyl-CoA dehydrogenase